MIQEFILIITICSSVLGQCLQPITISDTYNSHRECAIAGYINTLKVFESLPPERVNRYIMYGKFYCKEQTVL
tara:strand:- start:192 stop:410 length:219 start_codon:yes stop_codon:yes gene_type:complete